MWRLSFSPKRWLKRRSQQFIERAIPAAPTIRLGQKQLFILPSAAGWAFVLTGILVWFLGTNYENNLALALAYFMAAFFLVTLFHTFANLYHLEVSRLSAKPVFVGEFAQVSLHLRSGVKKRFAISAFYPDGNHQQLNLSNTQEATLTVSVLARYRGLFRPPRMTLESRYPAGLWRCWSYLDLGVEILTYPRPIPGPKPEHSLADDQSGTFKPVQGGEEFNNLRSYQQGDSLKHVAWKHFARGQGLLTKNYNAHQDTRLWLDWDQLQGLDREARLSRMVYLALEAEKTGEDYGLRLPSVEMLPSLGRQHLADVLGQLALFEWQAQAGLRSGDDH